MTSIAFWPFVVVAIKALSCRHTVSMSNESNAERGNDKRPRRAGPQAFFCGVAVLGNGDAITGELRLQKNAWGPRRRPSRLFRGALTPAEPAMRSFPQFRPARLTLALSMTTL